MLLLGKIGSLEKLVSTGQIHRANWLDPWWREIPPKDIGLAIVTLGRRDKKLHDVEESVAHLTGTGVPTMVVFNKVDESREKK